MYISFDGLKVQQNRYLSYLSSSSEGNVEIKEDSESCSRSTKERQTWDQKIRRKFNKCMNFFLSQGASCSYDDETKDNIKVPLRYINLEKEWVSKELPPINTNFCVNKRIYCIAPSSLHILVLFSMNGIEVSYKKVVEFMEYVGPYYNYKNWM